MTLEITKWTRKVLLTGACIDEISYPPIIHLQGITVHDFKTFAFASESPVLVYTEEDWRLAAPVFEHAVYALPHLNIVVRGFKYKGRKGLTAAIRRFEAVTLWIEGLWAAPGATQETVIAAFNRQATYGLSRKAMRKSRFPRKLREVSSTPPITKLQNKLPHLYPSTTMQGIIDIASVYTTRIFDAHGNEAWVMPTKTFSMLPVGSMLGFDTAGPEHTA